MKTISQKKIVTVPIYQIRTQTIITILWFFTLLLLPVFTEAFDDRNSSAKTELTNFVMQDLEFTLLSWKTPSGDKQGLEVWLQITEARLEKIKLLVREAELDYRVNDAINQVKDMLKEYKQLLRNLKLINYIDTAVRTEGDSNFMSNSSRLAGSFFSGYRYGQKFGLTLVDPTIPAILGTISSASEVLGDLGKDVERASKYHKLSKLRDNEINKLIAETKTQLFNKVGYLKDISLSLSKNHPKLKLPTFENTFGNTETNNSEVVPLQSKTSPFPYVARAYRLINTDRIRAAQQFSAAANQFPLTNIFSRDLFSQYYRVPYKLLAGHILEFESRISNNSDLAHKAVQEFDAAFRILNDNSANLSVVAYPYLIAYIRALAVSGQNNTRVMEFARYISNNMPSNSLMVAVQSYDLACVYSLLGKHNTALQFLRNSFLAEPRRDPQALNDHLLSRIVSKYKTTVEYIVNNPLIGVWKLESPGNFNSEFGFYVDGTFRQKRASGSPKVVDGRWELIDNSILKLTGRIGVSDSKSTFLVDRNYLILTYKENVFKYKRVDSKGLLDGSRDKVVSLSGRKLYTNGRWEWNNGVDIYFSRFTTIRSLSQHNRIFWYTHEDPLVGRIDQQLEQL